uniref:Uncharacterized protein n=1 Tax=Strigamia maritima TaxID=126957 RepID=T1IM26_STRMM
MNSGMSTKSRFGNSWEPRGIDTTRSSNDRNYNYNKNSKKKIN